MFNKNSRRFIDLRNQQGDSQGIDGVTRSDCLEIIRIPVEVEHLNSFKELFPRNFFSVILIYIR